MAFINCNVTTLLSLRKGVEVNIWDLATHTKIWTAKSVSYMFMAVKAKASSINLSTM